MWVNARFTEWAKDTKHPYHRLDHPKAEDIAFLVDGREIPSNDVLVASVTNGFVKYQARRPNGDFVIDEYRPRMYRRKYVWAKGRVDILVQAEGA